MSLAQLAPLATVPASFIAIQKGPAAEQAASAFEGTSSFTSLSEDIADFADTAAILSLADVLISVDSSPVHLAGALGREVWVMLPRVPDWRWLLDRDDTPWYPTMKLFRQTQPGDWSGVIARLVSALSAFAKTFDRTDAPDDKSLMTTSRLVKSRPYTLWLTGLSAAGKTTLACALEKALLARDVPCELLDGDVIRQQLSRDLGFSKEDRSENIRRVAARCREINDGGAVAIAALISPYAADRALARHTVGDAHFVEVHMATTLAVCESRDPKGLYRKARSGELLHFTGISDPYEAPLIPELRFDTDQSDIASCVALTLDWLGLSTN